MCYGGGGTTTCNVQNGVETVEVRGLFIWLVNAVLLEHNEYLCQQTETIQGLVQTQRT